jgi:nitrite reductase (NADH) small subunit
VSATATETWVNVCPLVSLTADRGVAALLDGEQVALFLLRSGEVRAIGNRDPFSGAMVLSRGIVGSLGDAVTIASPIFKQRFDLRTGRCLDDDTVAVPTYPVRVEAGVVQVDTSRAVAARTAAARVVAARIEVSRARRR